MFFCCGGSQKKKNLGQIKEMKPKEEITKGFPNQKQTQSIAQSTPEKETEPVATSIREDQNLSLESSKYSTSTTSVVESELKTQLTKFREAIRSTSQKVKIVTEEKEFIIKLIGSSYTQLYFLDLNWAQAYLNYLSHKIGNSPGPINNRNLLEQNTTITGPQILKPNLQRSTDYILVNQHVWTFLKDLYGGGPEILHLHGQDEVIMKFSPNQGQTTPASDLISIISMNQSLVKWQNSDLFGEFLIHKSKSNWQTYLPLSEFNKLQLPIVGLRNSSVLQCLMSLPELTWFIVNIESGLIRKKSKFLNTYQDFIKLIYRNKNGSVIPIQSFVQQVNNKFSSYEMHDSQELLLYLLGKFQDELRQPKVDCRIPKTSQEAIDIYKLNNQTIIDELFVGQMTSTIQCKNCKENSLQFDPFFDISLSLDKGYFIGRDSSLSECFKLFFKEEYIEGWECGSCKKKSSKVKRTFYISHSPNYLILHIKRFALFPKKQKIKDNVRIQNQIDLKSYCTSDVQHTNYQLKGLIIHSGGLDAGHYVAVVRREQKWFLFDDEDIQKVTVSDVTKLGNAYILFYEKII